MEGGRVTKAKKEKLRGWKKMGSEDGSVVEKELEEQEDEEEEEERLEED